MHDVNSEIDVLFIKTDQLDNCTYRSWSSWTNVDYISVKLDTGAEANLLSFMLYKSMKR